MGSCSVAEAGSWSRDSALVNAPGLMDAASTPRAQSSPLGQLMSDPCSGTAGSHCGSSAAPLAHTDVSATRLLAHSKISSSFPHSSCN